MSNELKTLLLERAVQFGDFTLASGAKSDVYVDGRLFTLSPKGNALVSKLLWERIQPLNVHAIGGMTMKLSEGFDHAALAHLGVNPFTMC